MTPELQDSLVLREGRNRPAWSRLALDLAILIAVGLALTAWTGRRLDRTHLQLHAFLIDQVDYVTGARTLLRTGSWDSSLIFPSLAGQPYTRNSYYLPGHFLLLAASYLCFGYGTVQSILPCVVSFVLTPPLIYLAARRLWDRRSGWLAAVVFWMVPFHVFFSLTAMCELTFVAMGALAICAFVYVPDRWKVVAGPFCLVPPFLCRESGAVLVLVMAALVYARSRRLRDSVLLVVLSVVLLGAILKSPVGRGRPSFAASNFVQHGGERYRDALAVAPTTQR